MNSSYVQEISFESMFWTFFSLSLKKVYTSRMAKKSQFRFSTVFRFIKMFIKTMSLSGQNRAQKCNTLGHKQRLSLVRIGQKSALLLYFWICHKIRWMSQRDNYRQLKSEMWLNGHISLKKWWKISIWFINRYKFFHIWTIKCF